MMSSRKPRWRPSPGGIGRLWRGGAAGRFFLWAPAGPDGGGAGAVAAEPRGDRQIVAGGELDRFLAADDRDPDRRVRLLYRTRPHRDIVVGPVFALVGEHLLGPGAGDDVVGLFEALARLGERHVVHLVFAQDAAGEAGNEAPVRQAIDHRQFLGEAQRLVQRHQIAGDTQLGPLWARPA